MAPDSHPVLTCAEAKAWEAGLLLDEAAEWGAMQRAGAAIARAVEADAREIGGLPEAAHLLVLAGKGYNAGDAFLAAKILLAARPRARADVLLCLGDQALRPLATRALQELQQAAGSRTRRTDLPALKAESADFDLCLDGVFGFQFRPPMADSPAEILAWVNTHPRIRLRAAVDLPSGVGEENAGMAFRADFTYATGAVKASVLEPGNAAWVGRLRYLDLGFFAETQPPGLQRVLLLGLLAPLARIRPAQADKRTFGHLIVVGGSRSYPGAVLMTVQSALRSGVGLLTAFVPLSLVPEYAARFPEAMWVGMPETAGGGLSVAGLPSILESSARSTAVVIGPGLGAEVESLALVAELVRHAQQPLLLDADALRPEILAKAAGKRMVVTPHAGEFRRIAGDADVRSFSRHQGAVTVLKGQPTQITDGTTAYYSLFGGPVLARGGSGDMLAGMIGGLLAQAPDDLLLAACRGVVWHGLAADLLARDKGQVAVQTTQLLDYLQPALRFADHATS
jgi:NAD(P)H-hydrate epimerase